MTKNPKYPMLSTIARLLALIGWLLVAGGTISALFGMVTLIRSHEPMAVLVLCSGLVAIIIGLIGAAGGEGVAVVFDIEANTRSSHTPGRVTE